ncbi:MAG: DUF4214 domain-containing protein [Pyrinomonadaceae bacterium]
MKFFSKVAKQFVCAAFVLACLTFITVLPAYALDEAQALASAPKLNGRIAFVSDRDGLPNIYTVNPDGSNVARLTSDGFNISPAWSPDGTKLAFSSNRDGNLEIYVMNADGTNQKRLTNDPANDGEPAWSPDGAKIAFTRIPAVATSPISFGSGGGLPIFSASPLPSPSPSGSPSPTPSPFSFIVVPLPSTPIPNVLPDIYVMNADGTNQTKLTDGKAPSTSPAWSPDGTRIAFTRLTVNISFTTGSGLPSSGLPDSPVTIDVYVMNADGSKQTKLTSGATINAHPAWSPDGTRLAFARGLSGTYRNTEIYVMNADGSNLKALTNASNVNSDNPTWSPDGTKIAFQQLLINGIAIGSWHIVAMNADGSNPSPVTFDSGQSTLPQTGTRFFMRLNVEPSWQSLPSPLVVSPTPTPSPAPLPPANFAPVTLTADQADFDVFTFRDRAIVRLRLTLPDAGYRITDFGQVARTGNDFSVDVKAEKYTGGGSGQVIVTLIRIYEMSNLAPGDYTFTLKSRDSLVRRKTFTVTSGFSFFKGNPIDEPSFFVDQHYRDFLNRAPDDGGLNYWSDQFSRCEKTNDAQCMSDQRVSISAAFFIEQEFQETGSFVYRMYKGTLNRQPAFNEFMTEREQVIGGANLDASKQTFADAFVQRPEFLQKYPQSLTQEQFVDALAATIKSTSGVNLSTLRSAYLSALQTGGRGLVVRQIIEDQAFQQAEYNRAFVLMQYFGYLRRDPDAEGYKFWIDVLDNRVPNNYRSMVNAFITSTEYRARFTN